MLAQGLFRKGIKLSVARITLDVTVPQPSANLRYFLIGKLLNSALDLLDGAHADHGILSGRVRKPKLLPNVQDEPRPWLARAVLLGARVVTAMVVGSGALLGMFCLRFSSKPCDAL